MKKIIITLLILVLLLTACQPTPQTEVVVGKDQKELIKKIEVTPETFEQIDYLKDVPQSFKGALENDKLHITIDAQIELPDNHSCPVIVIKPKRFTQEQADKILDVFVGDKPFYNTFHVETKADVEKKILDAKKYLSDPNTDWRQCTKGRPDEIEEVIAKQQEYIKRLEEEWANAPESAPPNFASRKLEPPKPSKPGEPPIIIGENEEIIAGNFSMGKDQDAKLGIYNGSPTPMQNWVRLWNLNKGDHLDMPDADNVRSWVNDYTDDEATRLKISKDDAIKTVDDIINQLGITDMTLAEIGIGKKSNIFDPIDMEERARCYELFYKRVVNGIQETYDCVPQRHEDSFSECIEDEVISVCIDETGILSFEWHSPMKVMEVLTDNTPLLPFEKIMERFNQQIFICGAWGEDILPNAEDDVVIIESKNICIDRISLGLARIKRQDHNGEYLLVPVWNFYGTDTTKYKETKCVEYYTNENYETVSRIFGHSFLTINAIDGSIINRELGY